ncbi:MAG: cobalamin-binding protein [Actinobacteria bacterium]|nr:cobalamin-binding protein [Actinomycetota bacterium]
MARVVSLVPSVTETLVALGSPPVGCTRFCDQPGIPSVGGTKNPDVEAIERLSPHSVIVNDEENRIEDVEAIEHLGIHTVSVSPHSIDDAGAAVARIAETAGVLAPEGFEGTTWKQWVEGQRVPAPVATAFVAVWARPWMSLNADTYGASLLQVLGLENVCARATVRYPEVKLTEIQSLGPEVVVLPSEPYPFREQHVPKVSEAFPNARVVLAEGRDLFWWGIRTPQAMRRLRTFFADALTG